MLLYNIIAVYILHYLVFNEPDSKPLWVDVGSLKQNKHVMQSLKSIELHRVGSKLSSECQYGWYLNSVDSSECKRVVPAITLLLVPPVFTLRL